MHELSANLCIVGICRLRTEMRNERAAQVEDLCVRASRAKAGLERAARLVEQRDEQVKETQLQQNAVLMGLIFALSEKGILTEDELEKGRIKAISVFDQERASDDSERC